MRILPVEDHPDLTGMFADHFVECGFVVDPVRTLEDTSDAGLPFS
jgi:DNA-binding response OmpR family regulator